MKWPVGKYNGWKIAGFQIIIKFNILNWAFNPIWSFKYGTYFFIWLFVTLRFYVVYEKSK